MSDLPIKTFTSLMAGEWKTGKTHGLLTVFKSKYVDPKRVLYIDNHESTRAFPWIHRYSQQEPWGIYEVDYTQVEEVDKKIDGIISAARTNKPLYDVIIWDDLTEVEFTTFAKEESKFAGKDKRQLWGEHLDNMCARQRRLSFKSGAVFLSACRVSAMDDFTKPGVRDSETKALIRPQTVRPLLRGKFGEWVPYNYDLLVWTRIKRVAKKPVNIWDFQPEGSIRCGHRWDYFPEWPQVMDNPQFDELVDLIAKAEAWGAANLQ